VYTGGLLFPGHSVKYANSAAVIVGLLRHNIIINFSQFTNNNNQLTIGCRIDLKKPSRRIVSYLKPVLLKTISDSGN